MKEENIGERVCGCELNEVFLDRSQKTWTVREKKIPKSDSTNKSFCSLKDTIKKIGTLLKK